jgi:hypothetical protein
MYKSHLAGADAQKHDFLCGKGSFDKVRIKLGTVKIFTLFKEKRKLYYKQQGIV